MAIIDYENEFDKPPIDYDRSKVPQNIKERTQGVLDAIYGIHNKHFIYQAIEIVALYAKEALESQAYDGNSLADVTIAKDGMPTLDARIKRDVNNLETKKADKAEVSAQLAQTVKKDETGVLDLNVFDEPTRNILQGQEPGTINAVLGMRNVLRENIAPRAVATYNTDFFDLSNNIIPDNFERGFSISPTTGLPVANNNFYLSNFVEVLPNTAYALRNVARWVLYDKEGEFIASDTSSVISDEYDARFVRFVVSIGNYNDGEYQANEGLQLKPFEKYRDPKLNIPNSITKDNIGDKEVTKDKTDFIRRSNNLFNLKEVTENKIINPDGTESLHNDYAITDYLPSITNTNYFVDKVYRVFRYNTEKEMLNMFEPYNNPEVFSTYNSAVYLRLVLRKDLLREAQLTQSNEPTVYEPYGYLFDDDINIGIDTEEKNGKVIDLWEEDRYIIEGVTEGDYEAPTIEKNTSINSMQPEDFYQLFDELVQDYPEYISRSLVRENTLGDPIYRYDFKPEEVPTISENKGDRADTKFPKMLILGGVHGYEKAVIYHLYCALKDVCENWKDDDLLETLRWNVHLIILPCVSQYGIRNGVRGNENGVDIARNFPVGFYSNPAQPGAPTYGGTEPFSEIETQAIDEVIQENLDNLILFTSLHTFSGTNGRFLWVPGATKLQITLGKSLVSKMTRIWKKRYPWVDESEITYFGYSDNGAPVGSEGRYGASLGIHSATFETSRLMSIAPDADNYSSESLTMGCETIINWLVMNLRENTKFYNKYRS